MRRLAILFALVPAAPALAQGPPPPPPFPPLPPPVAPQQNPTTPSKVELGRALFWDEQLSSTRQTSCGSCHFSTHGGSDPRSVLGDAASTHPGFDGVLGNADDVTGSIGVIRSRPDGTYELDGTFGLAPQVTRRKANSTIGAAYVSRLFWDGRADDTLVDPSTGQVVIAAGAALENQVLFPPVSEDEMGHVGRDWDEVVARIASSEPLALSPQVPASLSSWIAGRDYTELFDEAFGSPDVTAVRIAMAIATYERTLVPTQTPIDTFVTTGQGLTPLEQQGFQLFGQLNCVTCHAGNRFTNDSFQNIGLRPPFEDMGRFEVTGNPNDRGRFRVPSLRNVGDRGPYMHNGRFETLEEVVDFYDRGGDFNPPSKSPLIQPLGLTAQQKAALVAFLDRPLTDQRAVDETGPFERPLLSTESALMPTVFGSPSPGTNGALPHMVALEPPSVANPNMTLAASGGAPNAPLLLALNPVPAFGGIPVAGATSFVSLGPALQVLPLGSVASDGTFSRPFDLTAIGVPGLRVFAQWFVIDAGAPGGLLAASEGVGIELY